MNRPDEERDAAFVAHLDPEAWATVARALVRKMISEFAHERLLVPTNVAGDRYRLATEGNAREYRFRAVVRALDHWVVDEASIECLADGRSVALDPLSFVCEFAAPLGIGPETLPIYLEELTSTLSGAAWKRANERFDAWELARASFQEVETAMTEGHPTFVANNGRIGFGADESRSYAPESGAPVELVWLAAHVEHATFTAVDGLDHASVAREELGDRTVRAFREQLASRGLDPDRYLFLPVHPWQWTNKILVGFADDLALGRLVYLGRSDDRYLAQQSIRTFFNATAGQKRYVKTALSILNMGFMRGLSPHYMEATPAINRHVASIVRGDAFFREHGFDVLREVAAIGYRKPLYEAHLPRSSAYRKMLAALYRESPVARAAETGGASRFMTMAALLHRDAEGRSLLAELVTASDVGVEDWFRRYLDCYYVPLLHAFYAHDLAFMPHGENLILRLDGFVPRGAYLKDIGEEVAVFEGHDALPSDVRRIGVEVPDRIRLLSIFTDVFDGFFRYLASIAEDDLGLPESRFWELVAERSHRYQETHPQFAAKFARFDLFAERFAHSCLNRLQLRNNRQMVDLADPAGSLAFAGELENPIARFSGRRA